MLSTHVLQLNEDSCCTFTVPATVCSLHLLLYIHCTCYCIFTAPATAYSLYLHAVETDVDLASGGVDGGQHEGAVAQVRAVLLLADGVVLQAFGDLKNSKNNTFKRKV